jgi:hypothetical protein
MTQRHRRPDFLTEEEFRDYKEKFLIQRSNSYKRLDHAGNPIKFRISFEDWARIWKESGHWDQRATRIGGYVMTRYNDLGNYELGNVEIKLHTMNVSEGSQGRRSSENGHHHNLGKPLNLGIKRSPETVERIKAAALTRQNNRGLKVQTPHGVFDSIKAAAAHYGVKIQSVHYYLKKDPKNYYLF